MSSSESTAAASTLYIFYGSATGNAEQIAKDLSKQPLVAPFDKVECLALEKYKKPLEEWSKEPPPGQKYGICIVASTTGNGDPPENASRFVRYLKRKTTPQNVLQHTCFAILGLGDTNYDKFCNTGKILDSKMSELGGTRVMPLGMADEATGLEEVVEPWTAKVIAELAKACAPTESTTSADTGTAVPPSLPNATVTTTASVAKTTETKTLPDKKTATTVAPTTPSPSSVSFSPLFILYGSATGNAEHIAKDLASTYEIILKNPDSACFFSSVVCCELDQYKKKCLATWQEAPPVGQKHGLLIITSTTGNGDAPENASRFTRWIKRKTTPTDSFQHVAYGVLALGDTNYDQFCAAGKLVDKKLTELGGTRIKPLTCADEATGLEDKVEPWTNSVLTEITNVCRGSETAVASSKVTTTRTTSDSNEEKKMDDAVATKEVHVSGGGVAMARSLLNVSLSSSLPTVEHKDLPPLGSSRSSCELVHDDYTIGDGRRRSRGTSLAEMDRMTISSASTTALHYTMARPYQTSILNASYLTKTSSDAAKDVSRLLSEKLNDTTLVQAMDIFEKHFPLCGSSDPVVDECNGKRVIEMTLSLPDDFTLEYQPGDSLGIVVSNTPQAVDFVVNMLESKHGVQRTQKISIDANHPVTVEETVRNYVDLCSPIRNKRILHALSQFATNPDEVSVLRLLASKTPQGEALFQKLIDEQRMSVVDVFREFPSCQNISLEGLIGILPGIPPRYYSVSSSPLDNSALALTVAFSVVDYLTPTLMVGDKQVGQRRIGGIATRYLEVLCSPFLCGDTFSRTAEKLKIFPKPTAEFHLPAALSTPLILIGPGTGVAPFTGFLRHRQAQALQSQQAATAVVEGTWRGDFEMQDLPSDTVATHPTRRLGKIVLFFGCRRADHDWLFREEMERLEKEGVITELYTAFSRQEPKQYVQDIMVHDEACRASLADLILKENASIFICGDGNQMAKDVQGALAEVLSCHVKDAPAYLETLKKQGRFLMDIWTS